LIQGEGGYQHLRRRLSARLREICDANGWLLMLDEVQSGTAAPAHGSRSSTRASHPTS